MDIYDFSLRTLQGNALSMETFKGKVLLIVNTASKCGFTPQFGGLQKLYETYAESGFAVLGFPCNQFAQQDPGTAREIAQVCSLNYGVTFPMFEKTDVNGPNAHPLFQYLKQEKGGMMGQSIKWNFTKFLVDRSGRVVQRYAPVTKPAKLEKDIQVLLAD